MRKSILKLVNEATEDYYDKLMKEAKQLLTDWKVGKWLKQLNKENAKTKKQK